MGRNRERRRQKSGRCLAGKRLQTIFKYQDNPVPCSVPATCAGGNPDYQERDKII